jgi:hypothetical protein
MPGRGRARARPLLSDRIAVREAETAPGTSRTVACHGPPDSATSVKEGDLCQGACAYPTNVAPPVFQLARDNPVYHPLILSMWACSVCPYRPLRPAQVAFHQYDINAPGFIA